MKILLSILQKAFIALLFTCPFATYAQFTSSGPSVFLTTPSDNVGLGMSPGPLSFKLDVLGSINVSSGNAYHLNVSKILFADGTANLFLGTDAAFSYAGGGYNLMAGFNAGYNLGGGSYNSFLGTSSGYTLTSGDHNTLLGYNSGYYTTGNYNTILGSSSAPDLITGDHNIFVGYESAKYLIHGDRNVFVGNTFTIMYNSDTLRYNTSIGYDCQMSGIYNTAVGWQANAYNGTLCSTTLGVLSGAFEDSIVALGYLARGGNGSASSIVIGNKAIAQNSEKSTIVGMNSYTYNGDNNIVLGYGSYTNTCDNCSAYGFRTMVSNSNTTVFGNSDVVRWGFGVEAANTHAIEVGTGSSNGNGAYLSATGTWTNTSDITKKENIVKLDSKEILNSIMKLSIPRWNYKGDETDVMHIGPMAQQFYEVFKVGNDNKSISTIDPAGIALIGIQQLKKESDTNVGEIGELRFQNKQLQQQIFLMVEALKKNGIAIENVMNNVSKSGNTDLPTLEQNYPNPASDGTEINYYIPTTMNRGTIIVYDMQGLKIKTVMVNPGSGTITLFKNELKDGTYFYELSVDGGRYDIKKMIISSF